MKDKENMLHGRTIENDVEFEISCKDEKKREEWKENIVMEHLNIGTQRIYTIW